MADLKLDFIITPTYSTKTIAVHDNSTYPNNPPTVGNPTLEISVPGFDTVQVPFNVNELNILNSTTLGITTEGEEDIPDGVYVINYSVTSSYINYVEKTFLRVEQLQQKFDTAFMKLDMMRCDKAIKKQQKITLDTINYYIQGAIAAANNCAVDEAVKLYKKADKLLYDFTERGSCNITFPTNFY